MLLASAALAALACHPYPVVGGAAAEAVGGTIAGIVSTEGKTPVEGRKVTATNTATGAKFDATTGNNGGYTIKVPRGTYRIEVELQAGEKLAKQPGDTKVNKSDVDARRDFIITTGRPGGTLL